MIPLDRAAGLLGIAQAAAATRDAIDVVLRQRAVQTQAAGLAARSAARGARASAALEGGDPDRADDPMFQGAVRATGEAGELAGRWRSAPLQVLARLHLLSAADLADPNALGRPRDSTAARRLTALVAQIGPSARPGSAVPAVLVAAMVHAEAAEAFTPAGGLVGRSAERVVLIASGVDPAGVLVPEAGHRREQDGYAEERRRLLTGTDVAVATWIERCCRAYTAAAEETAALLAGDAG
jgi:hypothetical protein